MGRRKQDKKTEHKTNAMRILDQHGISYEASSYEVDESDLSGTHVADSLGLSDEEVFKTLVTRAQDGELFVFVIPVGAELNLKKAAAAAGKKKVEMIRVREIEDLTGYIRGGCSPIGMKKLYPTFLDEMAALQDLIYVSAGRRGLQIHIAPEDILSLTGGAFADLV